MKLSITRTRIANIDTGTTPRANTVTKMIETTDTDTSDRDITVRHQKIAHGGSDGRRRATMSDHIGNAKTNVVNHPPVTTKID